MDHRVQCTETLPCCAEGGGHRDLVGGVGLSDEHRATGRLDFADRGDRRSAPFVGGMRFQPRVPFVARRQRAAGRQQQPRAMGLAEPAGDREAHAAEATGDEATALGRERQRLRFDCWQGDAVVAAHPAQARAACDPRLGADERGFCGNGVAIEGVGGQVDASELKPRHLGGQHQHRPDGKCSLRFMNRFAKHRFGAGGAVQDAHRRLGRTRGQGGGQCHEQRVAVGCRQRCRSRQAPEVDHAAQRGPRCKLAQRRRQIGAARTIDEQRLETACAQRGIQLLCVCRSVAEHEPAAGGGRHGGTVVACPGRRVEPVVDAARTPHGVG